MFTFPQLLAVGAGGFIGSIARFLMVRFVDQRLQSIFPFGTLLVNFLGSLAFGIIAAVLAKKTGIHPTWGLFLGTGICGGFTTFSAFSFENLNLLHHKPLLSLAYISSSLLLGIVAAGIGYWIGKNL